MPSYADEYAARNPHLRASYSGPVRLVISRGDSRREAPVDDVGSNDKWNLEEGMDVEAIDSVKQGEIRASDPQKVIIESMGLHSLARRTIILLVLDTNILIKNLPLTEALYEECFKRGLENLQDASNPPSPLKLIIPRIVNTELDHLKSHFNSDTSSQARKANRWIFEILRRQKKQTFRMEVGGLFQHPHIPVGSWILHLEDRSYANELLERSQRSPSPLTNDEIIINLTNSLNALTGVEAFFCSDDVNARTIAEAEGLNTFSFSKLAEGMRKDDASLKRHAKELVDQWVDQAQPCLSNYLPSTNISNMDEDIEFDLGASSSPQKIPRIGLSHSSPPPSNRKTRSSTSRTTQDSIHAVVSSSKSSLAAPYHMRTRASYSSPPRRAVREMKRENYKRGSQQYSSDRSISSSIWAPHK